MILNWYEQSQAQLPSSFDWLNDWEKAHLSSLRIPKRKSDWVLGRWTAKNAMASFFGLPNRPSELARIEVWPLPSGAPQLFVDGEAADIQVSLSHCRGVAVCVVGPANAIFGCDIEAIEPRPKALVADYFTAEEQTAVETAEESKRNQLITLIWSAKESALKALRTGLRADTRSLTVTVPDEGSRAKLACRQPGLASPCGYSWHALWVRCADGVTFTASWCSDGRLVRTAVERLGSDVPTRLPDKI